MSQIDLTIMYYHLFLFSTMFYIFTYFAYTMLEKLATLNSLSPKKEASTFVIKLIEQKDFKYIIK